MRRLSVLLLACLIFLYGCTPPAKEGPYTFYQATDQILSVDILEADTNYTGLQVPVRVVESLEKEDFCLLVELFSAVDGFYDFSNSTYMGTHAVRIHYLNGGIEILYPYGSAYVAPNSETDISSYYFGLEAFYAVISQFSDISFAVPS